MANNVDWSQTRAYFPSAGGRAIWINLKGREPAGVVDPADFEALRDEIIAKLGALRDVVANMATTSRKNGGQGSPTTEFWRRLSRRLESARRRAERGRGALRGHGAQAVAAEVAVFARRSVLPGH